MSSDQTLTATEPASPSVKRRSRTSRIALALLILSGVILLVASPYLAGIGHSGPVMDGDGGVSMNRRIAIMLGGYWLINLTCLGAAAAVLRTRYPAFSIVPALIPLALETLAVADYFLRFLN